MSKKNSGEETFANQNKMRTWNHVICSNEMQLEVFAHRDMSMFGEKKGKSYNPNSTVPIVKHGGGGV